VLTIQNETHMKIYETGVLGKSNYAVKPSLHLIKKPSKLRNAGVIRLTSALGVQNRSRSRYAREYRLARVK